MLGNDGGPASGPTVYFAAEAYPIAVRMFDRRGRCLGEVMVMPTVPPGMPGWMPVSTKVCIDYYATVRLDFEPTVGEPMRLVSLYPAVLRRMATAVVLCLVLSAAWFAVFASIWEPSWTVLLAVFALTVLAIGWQLHLAMTLDQLRSGRRNAWVTEPS